jgi:preprotein translocase subunit YajC
MYDFTQFVSDLISGLIAGFVISGMFWFIESRKQKHRLNQVNALISIMGRAIKHRNKGEDIQASGQASDDEKEIWVNKAIIIKKEAIVKAKEINPASGAIIEWLDRIPPYTRGVEVQRWVSLLSETIGRIRTILEKNI